MTALRRAATRCTTSASSSRWTSHRVRGSRHCWPAARHTQLSVPDAARPRRLPRPLRRPGLRAGQRLDARSMLPCSPSAAATPTAPASVMPLDPLLWRAERAGRAVLGRRLARAPVARLAHRVHGDRLEYLGHALRPSGRRHRPGLPAPRDERRAGLRTHRGGGALRDRHYVHQAMVGYEGEKMSKSKGNLVLVSTAARGEGVDPMAIRLVLLGPPLPHRLGVDRRRTCTGAGAAGGMAGGVVRQRGARAGRRTAGARERVADDLDTPGALALVDAWAARDPGPARATTPRHRADPLGARCSTRILFRAAAV
jgi:L-cysteine:1D-myo-inositol 2-amino-2-deoxy-alpha-D-glucopyranoside ligase